MESRPPTSQEHPADRIGPYTVMKRLGRGGAGQVYLAERGGAAGFLRKVVIKKMLRAHDHESVARFMREARLASRFHHPNIVQVIEFEQYDGEYCLVMEYLEGRNVRELLQRLEQLGATCPLPIALRIVTDMASALQHAHEHRGENGELSPVVHRDATPENVMVTASGQVKLLDFGVAREEDGASCTQAGHVVGKPLYVPPEALAGGKPTPMWDTYAFGMLFYELLAGTTPYHRPKAVSDLAMMLEQIAREPPRPLRRVAPWVPVELSRIAMRALQKSPERRHAHVGEVVAELAVVRAVKPADTATVCRFLADLFADEPAAQVVARLGAYNVSLPARVPKRSHDRAGGHGLTWAAMIVTVLALGAAGYVVREQLESPRTTRVEEISAVDVYSEPIDAETTDAAPPAAGRSDPGVPSRPRQPPRQRAAGKKEVSATGEGQLTVECAHWAWVKLDGVALGTCPLGPVRVPAGRHEVLLESNAVAERRSVRIEAGRRTVVSFGGKRKQVVEEGNGGRLLMPIE